MTVVIGLEIHRQQVTFDALNDVTGEVQRGRIAPADRLALRRSLSELPAGQVDVRWSGTSEHWGRTPARRLPGTVRLGEDFPA
jgi:hypothetical protein